MLKWFTANHRIEYHFATPGEVVVDVVVEKTVIETVVKGVILPVLAG